MELTAQPRTVLGKKVKQLRRQGITPLHVFGPGFESQAFQTSTPELIHVLATTPRTQLLKLTTGEDRPRARKTSFDVLIKDVQRDPVTGELLHVDLYRTRMDHPVAADVPFVLTGLSPAVDTHLGTLVTGATSLHVQGLPGDLPASIEVDVSVLVDAHSAIHARDIQLPPGITLLSDGDVMVANIVAQRGAEEAVAEAEAEAEAAPGVAAPEEGEETAAEQAKDES